MSTIPCPNEGCQEIFANRMGKSRHLKSGKCRGKNPESNDLKTLFQKNDDGTYACIQCQNTIKHATNLKRHASKCETKTKEKHICGTCGKEFARRSKLKVHEGIHRRARFICNQCNKSFKRNDHFKKHVCEDEDEDEGYLPTFVANVFDGDNGRLEERNSELDEDESAVNVFDDDNGRLEERNSELDEDESAVNVFDDDNGRLEERNSELDEDESAVNVFDGDNGRLEERNSELDEDESAVNVFDGDNGRLEERNSELDEDESAVNVFDDDNGRLEERNSELDEDESAVNVFDDDNGRLEERNSELDEDESAVNVFDDDNGRLEERNSELDEDESAVNDFDDDNGRLEERNSELDEDESAVNVFDDDNGRLEERNSELDEDESAVNVFDGDNGRLEERNSELDEDESAVNVFDDDNGRLEERNSELDEDESAVNVFDDDNGRLEERNSELDEDESAVNVFDDDNGRLEERNSELDEDESAVNDFDDDNGRLEERNSELDEDESAVNVFDDDNGRLEERNSELDEDESAVNVFDDDNGRLEERNSELDEDESAVNVFDDDNGRLEERNSELDEDQSAVLEMLDYHVELDEDESVVNVFDCESTPVKIKEKRIKDTIQQMRYRKHQKMNDELIDVSKIERRNILDKLLLADDDNEKYNQVYISSVANYFRRMIKSKRYVGTNQQRVAVEILKSMFGSHLAEASFCKWLAMKLEVEEMEFTSFLQISDKEVVVDRGGRSFLSKELRLDVYEYWIANSEVSVQRSNNRHLIKVSMYNVRKQIADIIISDTNIEKVQTKRGEKLQANRCVTNKTYEQIYRNWKDERNMNISIGSFLNLKPFYVTTATVKEMEMCLCGKCLNPHNIYKAIKSAINEELPKSLSEYVSNELTCSKDTFNKFHKLDCITGKCNKSCKGLNSLLLIGR